ncbi:CubicO group peptidase (beta-lactamase class C family) [Salirhabdus euzebyi]|uniref:CubicO group peptidase (Beta-lactamase class C family) n=1 Tax=Salirhabdus euzebyi TaxID=394506 RepID=A0A841Q628_9BACI|nr:serine hydrolase domain-containing protein [Salirhabdus euzebyi]MBB6453772.1 CubicO group peptidase (beta-lactamase class C family) [Salirhabdus euzebyi]
MLNTKKLEQFIEENMLEKNVPGLALGIIKDGKILYQNGFGYTSTEETAIPISPRTLFSLGSVTKPLTGSMIMKLVEEGTLGLDEPVISYIPWFKLEDAAASKAVTLRMLLSHTAGLPHLFEQYGSLDSDASEKLVRSLSQQQLSFFPGKTWSYSDLGIDTAGYIIEFILKNSFKDIMKERLFAPLEMEKTTFDHLEAMTYPLALSHFKNEDGKFVVNHKYIGGAAQNPSSFAISNVEEMLKFLHMLLSDGMYNGRPYLSQESIKEMFSIQGDYYLPNDAGYGLTFETDNYKGIRRIWHDGAVQSFGSWIFMAPEQQLGVVLLTNRIDGFWDTCEELVHLIFDQVLDLNEQSVQIPNSYVGETINHSLCTGTYYGPWIGIYCIEEVNGQLYFKQNNKETLLIPFGKDRYVGNEDGREIALGFLPHNGNTVTDMMVNGIPCEKVSNDPAYRFNVTNLNPYLGSFQKGNDLLRFHVSHNQLMCFDEYDQKDYDCIFLSESKLMFANCLIEFMFLEDGSLPSVRLNKGKILLRIDK